MLNNVSINKIMLKLPSKPIFIQEKVVASFLHSLYDKMNTNCDH